VTQVFIVPFHVKPTPDSIMPANFIGAYVRCYVAAADYKEAVVKCIDALRIDGLQAEEVLQPIQAMEASDWSQHIVDQWPDHATQMPNQAEFEASLIAGKVIYGPFGAYDRTQ
jgi:hypothetical protein